MFGRFFERAKEVGSRGLVVASMAAAALGVLYGLWVLQPAMIVFGVGMVAGGTVVAWSVGPRLAEAENWEQRGALASVMELAEGMAELERITGEQAAVLAEVLAEPEPSLFPQLVGVS